MNEWVRQNTRLVIGACSPLITTAPITSLGMFLFIPRTGRSLFGPSSNFNKGDILNRDKFAICNCTVNMDSVRSGSKCGGSDFSIERILSDDTRNKREDNEVPEWLCCTRYRPPRLPRAPSGCRARRAGRHARVPFTAAQAAALEAAYSRAPYLAPPALKALAAALQLRDDRIKIWFQNRRARERREKSSSIAPPHAVTLPPTTIASSFTWCNTVFTNVSKVQFMNGQDASFKEEMVERPETPLDIETVEDED